MENIVFTNNKRLSIINTDYSESETLHKPFLRIVKSTSSSNVLRILFYTNDSWEIIKESKIYNTKKKHYTIEIKIIRKDKPPKNSNLEIIELNIDEDKNKILKKYFKKAMMRGIFNISNYITVEIINEKSKYKSTMKISNDRNGGTWDPGPPFL